MSRDNMLLRAAEKLRCPNVGAHPAGIYAIFVIPTKTYAAIFACDGCKLQFRITDAQLRRAKLDRP